VKSAERAEKRVKKTGASLFRLSSGASLLQGHVVKTEILSIYLSIFVT
jgi:hypothetical protein